METQKTIEQGLQYADLHVDYQTWISELTFYKNEIGFFQRFLDVYARSQNSAKNGALIEQFQNKLIVQHEQTDLLLHEIRKFEQNLIEYVKTQVHGILYVQLRDHQEWTGKIETHRKLYNAMKHDFYREVSHD